jgi:hypothetical protein
VWVTGPHLVLLGGDDRGGVLADRQATAGAVGFVIVVEQYGQAVVWVPNWSSTSCNLGVFVYQPAEQITTSQVNLGRRCKWW